MGGSWERVQDVFPLFAGTTYAAGSMGGEANVTLTTNEIPPHDHVLNVYNIEMDAPSGESVITPAKVNSNPNMTSYPTRNTGGGQPHNNMPPYRAFYCWERVA